MLNNRVLVFLFAFCLLAGSFSLGKPDDGYSDELVIKANYKEQTKERIFATGNVEIHYRNVKLFADRVELNTKTKDVFAEGNVVMQMPDEVVSMEELRFNLDSARGELKKGFGMIQPTIQWEAETVERKEGGVYSLHKASVTSCTQVVPRWKFSTSKANFKKDDYIEMWNTVFSIKKVPIFYVPYMRYPLDKEKSTGFLTPQLGFSGTKGLILGQSFYWAIKRNMDATFDFNYYSAKGMGGGLEYRYLYSGGTRGQLRWYYFQFNKNPGQEQSEKAYIFRLNHDQTLPYDFKLVADVNLNTSFNFLREFDNDFKRALAWTRSSQVYLQKFKHNFRLNVRVAKFETYFSEINLTGIRQYLPEISFSTSWIKLFSPLFFSFSTNFISWEDGPEGAFARGTQKHSRSLELRPTFSIPFNKIPWLNVNSLFSPNFGYHFQSLAPNTGAIVDEPLLAHNYSFRMAVIGPVFNKIYFNAQGKPKVKHIIEPAFTYYYENPPPFFERIITPYPMIYGSHQISYALTNRFLIKRDGMAVEACTLGFSQIFYINEEYNPLKIFPIEGKIPKFSDIFGYLRFYPGSKYSIDAAASYNPYEKKVSTLRLGATLGNYVDPLFLRINWYKSINLYVEDVLGDRHQINLLGGIKIPRISLEAMGEIDFNIKRGEMLYSSLAVIYHYQCLDFKADLRIFYFREKPETQFRISFGLGNIGKTTDFLGGMGFD